MSDATIFGRAVLDRLTALEISLFGGVANYSDITNFERAVLARIGALEVQKFGSVTVEPDTTSFTRAVLDRLTALEGAGGSSLLPITFDTWFGTDTVTAAATGWFAFGLKLGCRRIWLNSSGGNDANDGLTAATAKATFSAAWTAYKTGWTAGDQLMIAGTGGRSYTDPGTTGGWSSNPGFSNIYPTAFLCYDPADAANAAKYGKLYGSNRPIFLSPAAGSVLSNTLDNTGKFAVQGIIIDGQNADSATISLINRHDDICFQNNQLKEIALQFDNGNETSGIALHHNVSKNAFYGQWRAFDGNTNGLFDSGIDGTSYFQDNVFAHCGWQVGASRSDQTAYGGPSGFGHGVYHPAHNMGGHYDRNVYVDSASDGWGLRGYATATQPVSIDEPIVGAFSGFSGGPTEAPNGVVITVDDFVAMGGDNLTTDPINGGRGEGPGINNIISPSYIRNGVLLDNPQMNNGNSWVIGISYKYAGQFTPMTLIMDKIRAWNYSYRAQSTGYLGLYTVGSITVTWSNALLDSLFSDQTGPGATGTISGTGVRAWAGGDYPNPLTKAQVIAALGFADAASMKNAMLDFPHLPWAQAIIGIVFPAFGATPLYATASVPSLAGLPTPTVVYSSDTTAPTLSTLTVSGVGTTTATLNSTTNDGSGFLYWVVSTSAAPPNQYQMGNGQDSAGSAGASVGRQAVSSSGAQAVSITGLALGVTYFAYQVQQDPAGNRSSIISSTSFTTAAATGWNNSDQSGGITVSGTNNVTANNPSGFNSIRSTPGFTGKKYWEVLINSTTGITHVGVADAAATFADWIGNAGGPAKGASLGSDGVVYANGSNSAGASFTAGDRVGIAVDEANKLVWFAVNNTFAGNPSAGTGGLSISTVTAPLFATFQGTSGAQNVTGKFSAASQSFAPPTGFSALG